VTQSKEKRREKGEGVADKGVELATKDDGGGVSGGLKMK
jgi:hypothetical protein